jgi:hypothetical protein
VKSEMIKVGNKTYVKLDDVHMGKTKLGDDSWSLSHSTPQEAEKLVLDAMRDAVKAQPPPQGRAFHGAL